MDSDDDNELAERIVLQRTSTGSRALLLGAPGLDAQEKRLLGMVTGYTSLSVLEDLGLDGRRIRPAARRLMDQGLVVSVAPTARPS